MRQLTILTTMLMVFLIGIPCVFAFNTNYKNTNHHDYDIEITAKDGSYDSASLVVSVRHKHPGTRDIIRIRLMHEVWTRNFESSSSRNAAQNYMDDYGELDPPVGTRWVGRTHIVPIDEILQPHSARDYPYGLFIIEVEDGHTTHPYIIGYKRDIRRITFRGMQLYCNVHKYWGNWEYELASDRDKPDHCN